MSVLTDAEKSRINAALGQTRGDRKSAATLLQMDPLKLKDTIHGCPELRLRWAKSRAATRALTPVETVARPRLPVEPAGPEPLKSGAQVEAEMALQETKLHQGLNRLPLTEQEKEMAQSLHSFHMRHTGSNIDMIHGCASMACIKLTAKLTQLLRQHDELIDAAKGLQGENLVAALTQMDALIQAMPQFAGEIRKLAEMVGKNGIAKALLDLKRQQSNSPKGRGKPGFRPLVAVNAPGGKVEINDGR